jgi:hypothetical protein
MSRLLSALLPSLVFVALYVAVRICRLDRARFPWRAGAILITGLLLAVAALYCVLPVLLEDTESTIASVAALILRGGQMYPAPDAAQRYILLYGPLAYLGRSLFLVVFGTNLIAFKFAGFAALVSALFFAYRTARSYGAPFVAWIATGAFALIAFRFLAASMWGRCDPFLLCAAAIGIWAASRGRFLVTAFAMAALVDLKITGVAYALPILILLAVNTRWSAVVYSVCGATAFAFLPFLLPQVSLHNYLFALSHASQHGLEPEFLFRNLQYSALLLLPILVCLPGSRLNKKQSVCLAGVAAGLLLSSAAGAKIGAGSYHLLPHIAALLQLFLWISNSRTESCPLLRQVASAWVLTWLVFSIKEWREVEQGIASVRFAAATESEIESVVAANPGRAVEVGVGDRYEDPRARYGFLTTFRGQPYTLAYAALRDLQLGGVPVPESTLQAIASCATPVWLIPKNQIPFAAPNTYFAKHRPAFDGIEGVFADHYTKRRALSEYDVWTCKNFQ